MSPLRRALWLFSRSPLDHRRNETLDKLAALVPMFEDGSLLLKAIHSERLIPLSFIWLRALQRERLDCVSDLSTDFWAKLKLLYHRVVAYNLHMIEGWRLARAALDTFGVLAIPIKGPALSALAYGDGALRQVEDLDAIIPMADMECAIEALSRAGFRPGKVPSESHRTSYVRSLQDWEFADEQGRVLDIKPVPISHTIARPEDVGRVQARLKDVTLDAEGRTVWRAPDRVAMTILVCMQGVADGWPSMRQVADVASLLIRLSPDEWMDLYKTSAEWRQQRTVACGVDLCQRLDLLPEITGSESWQVPPTGRRWLDSATARLVAETISPVTPFEAWRCATLFRDNPRDWRRCVWRQITVPSVLDWEYLPNGWPAWSVRLIRPIRLWGMRRQLTISRLHL